MPAQHGIRLHQTKVLAPTVRPEAAKPDPQNPIRSPDAGMRVGAQGDLELMAEDQVLQREIPARANRSDERTNHKEE
jgi:hypothetical protein